jgi:prevent-host-death family protein
MKYRTEGGMREIGAAEAKLKFGQLLDEVEGGEEVVITRRGRRVARLTPAEPAFDYKTARRAADEIRVLAREMNLGPFDWEEWRRYRDEGRP